MNNSEKQFQWTDELVKEFIDTYNSISGWITGIDPRGDKMKEFKQSRLTPERIEVGLSTGFSNDANFKWISHLYATTDIPKDKLPVIKQAIESVLNNNRVHIDGTWSIHSEGQKTYTQSEVDVIREETFYAARLVHPLAGMKYDTFEDYIQSLIPKEELMYNSTSTKRVHPKNDLCEAMGCVKYDEKIHK